MKSVPGRASRRRIAVAAALIPVFGLAACAKSTSNDSNNPGSTSAASAGFAFYKGKTITYYQGATPGGVNALAAQAYLDAMAKKLQATINVKYITPSGGISTPEEDQLAAANPDGLTIGWLGVTTWVFQEATNSTAKVDFPLQKEQLVGGLTGAETVFASCSNSSVNTAQDLLASKRTLSVIELVAQQTTMFARLALHVLDVPHKNLDSFSSTPQLVTGCMQGSGDLTVGSAPTLSNSAQTALNPGITPLFLSGKLPSGWPTSWLNNKVPTLSEVIHQAGKQSSSDTQALDLLSLLYSSTAPNSLTFAPAGTPPARVAALRQAMEWAVNQPSVQKALNKISNGPTYVSPADLSKDIDSYVKNMALLGKLVSS